MMKRKRTRCLMWGCTGKFTGFKTVDSELTNGRYHQMSCSPLRPIPWVFDAICDPPVYTRSVLIQIHLAIRLITAYIRQTYGWL